MAWSKAPGPEAKSLLLTAFRQALEEAHPYRLTLRALPKAKPHLILAVGKGAAWMLRAALDRYGEVHYHLTLPQGQEALGLRAVFAGHPLPDGESQRAAQEVLGLLKGLPPKARVLALVSGGGSALWCLPLGISLEEKRALTEALLRSGASIGEINTVRKHLSRVKGGRLLLATPARVQALLLSDVPGDDPGVIASGPFHPDPTTYADALAVLDRYRLAFPEARRVLEEGARGRLPETLKPQDPALKRLSHRIVGRNLDLLEAAQRFLRGQGHRAVILSDRFGGEARALARFHAELVETIRTHGLPFKPPLFLLSGGEAQVQVRGKGQGGRNLEFLLSLYAHLKAPLYALAADSDGLDGPSGAAGALLTPEVWDLGLDPRPFLAENDSLGFFQKAGTLLKTGPTGTNLNDFRLLFVE
ncbi:glycerate kinase type-2 family protein [Thermus amyloliquefaciens]|uniref:glycerate kinase type-2 family protein n=1 Tax=Thermus amyloliquefaciens TaxID=1449080 RepID=UPI000571764E|nr:glycerate kinase [Thermus amyloliquefaciens]